MIPRFRLPLIPPDLPDGAEDAIERDLSIEESLRNRPFDDDGDLPEDDL